MRDAACRAVPVPPVRVRRRNARRSAVALAGADERGRDPDRGIDRRRADARVRDRASDRADAPAGADHARADAGTDAAARHRSRHHAGRRRGTHRDGGLHVHRSGLFRKRLAAERPDRPRAGFGRSRFIPGRHVRPHLYGHGRRRQNDDGRAARIGRSGGVSGDRHAARKDGLSDVRRRSLRQHGDASGRAEKIRREGDVLRGRQQKTHGHDQARVRGGTQHRRPHLHARL